MCCDLARPDGQRTSEPPVASPLYGLHVGVFTAIVYDVVANLVGGVVLEISLRVSP